MKIEGNVNFYVNKMQNKDGSIRYAVSIGIFTKKKDVEEYARLYIPCILSKDIPIGEKTPAKFRAHLDDASLIASEWNGNTTLKVYVGKISKPVEDEKSKTVWKEKTQAKKEEAEELPY